MSRVSYSGSGEPSSGGYGEAMEPSRPVLPAPGSAGQFPFKQAVEQRMLDIYNDLVAHSDETDADVLNDELWSNSLELNRLLEQRHFGLRTLDRIRTNLMITSSSSWQTTGHDRAADAYDLLPMRTLLDKVNELAISTKSRSADETVQDEPVKSAALVQVESLQKRQWLLKRLSDCLERFNQLYATRQKHHSDLIKKRQFDRQLDLVKKVLFKLHLLTNLIVQTMAANGQLFDEEEMDFVELLLQVRNMRPIQELNVITKQDLLDHILSWKPDEPFQ